MREMTIFKEKACLVAYFSRAGEHCVKESLVHLPQGNTEAVAKIIHACTGADEFCIQTKTPYPCGLRQTAHMAQRELYADARPELAVHLDRMEQYAIVFLGYPIWWGNPPMPVISFLEEYDFAGKVLIPFCTHEGSGFGHSERTLHIHCPQAKRLPGLAVHASEVHASENQVLRWLKKTKDLL